MDANDAGAWFTMSGWSEHRLESQFDLILQVRHHRKQAAYQDCRMNSPTMETCGPTSMRRFPPDLAALFGADLIILTLGVSGALVANGVWTAQRDGDLSLLVFAMVLGVVGSGVLLRARLPLYRQRRFASIGPGGLDHPHRQLYGRAYGLIGISVGILVLLLVAVG